MNSYEKIINYLHISRFDTYNKKDVEIRKMLNTFNLINVPKIKDDYRHNKRKLINKTQTN